MRETRSYEPPDWARLIRVFGRAVDRMQMGSKTYGEFNPETDTRCLLSECQEELLDAINYLAMQYEQIEILKSKLS